MLSLDGHLTTALGISLADDPGAPPSASASAAATRSSPPGETSTSRAGGGDAGWAPDGSLRVTDAAADELAGRAAPLSSRVASAVSAVSAAVAARSLGETAEISARTIAAVNVSLLEASMSAEPVRAFGFTDREWKYKELRVRIRAAPLQQPCGKERFERASVSFSRAFLPCRLSFLPEPRFFSAAARAVQNILRLLGRKIPQNGVPKPQLFQWVRDSALTYCPPPPLAASDKPPFALKRKENGGSVRDWNLCWLLNPACAYPLPLSAGA